MRQGLGHVKPGRFGRLFLLGAALVCGACERKVPQIGVGGAHIVLPLVAGRPATLYFVVDASSFTGASDPLPSIRGVTVEGAARAEIHRSMTMDGMTGMRPLASVPLEHGVTRFCPGGYHVMLFDTDARFKAGSQTRVHITLSNGSHLDPDAGIVSFGDEVMAEAPYACAEAE